MPDKNTPGSIDNVGFDTGRDEPDDLFLKLLPIAVAILVPDHQIHRQPLEAPVGVRLHELAHEFDMGGVGNLQQHDRQVTGDCVAPEAGLPATVFDQDARGRAQRCVGVNDRAGEAAVELRIGFGGVELPEHHLAVRPGQLEHAIREPGILVFVDEMQHGIPRLGGARNHVDGRRRAGLDA